MKEENARWCEVKRDSLNRILAHLSGRSDASDAYSLTLQRLIGAPSGDYAQPNAMTKLTVLCKWAGDVTVCGDRP